VIEIIVIGIAAILAIATEGIIFAIAYKTKSKENKELFDRLMSKNLAEYKIHERADKKDKSNGKNGKGKATIITEGLEPPLEEHEVE